LARRPKNPQLREVAHQETWEGCPASSFMRTLWVCNVSGGPLPVRCPPNPARRRSASREAHRDLRIPPRSSTRVAAELGRTLDYFKVPQAREGVKSWAAFAAHKGEVTAGYAAANKARLKRSGFLSDNPAQPRWPGTGVWPAEEAYKEEGAGRICGTRGAASKRRSPLTIGGSGRLLAH